MKGTLFSKYFLPGAASVLVALVSLGACESDKDLIINQKVNERLKAFREKKNTECLKILMHEAEQTVDSLLLAEAKMGLSDSLTRMRPFKPAKPAPLPPIDSLQVKPIFDSGASQ